MSRDAVSYLGLVLSLLVAAALTLLLCHLREQTARKPAPFY